MKFAHPAFLWALVLLAIPIIIHLFNFRRYKILYFSSLKFIKHVDQNANSTRNLKQIIVLILRCLAFVAFILAFAQPYIPTGKNSENLTKNIYAIYIDNSNSMTLRGSEGELLSEAREAAKGIINKVSDDSRFLVNTNELSGMEGHLISKIDALDRIDKIVPSSNSKQLDQILNWQKDILEKNKNLDGVVGKRQYLMLSDFQKITSSFNSLLPDTSAVYYPIKFRAEKEENIFIDTVYFSSPLHQINQTSELNVRVTNLSDVNLVNQALNFKCNSINRDIYLDIPANQSITTSIKYTEKDLGILKGQVSINDKQVTFDDTYYFAYEVRKNLNVLVLDFEDAVSNVTAVYRLDPFYIIQNISANAFTQDRLNEQDLVILNGCNEVSSGMQEILSSFVENSGALAIFPGTNLKTTEVNTWLNKMKMPQLSKLNGSGVGLKSISYSDPFFSGVFENKPTNINLPLVKTAYSQLNSGSAVSLLNLQNGSSLFYKASGGSKVYLFTSSLNSSFGSFTSNALFPAILLRMAELSQRLYPESIEIGKESKFPIYGKVSSDEPIKISGNGVEFIPQSTRSDNKTYISLSQSESQIILNAGFYEIKVSGKLLGILALNYNREESQIKSLTADEIKESMLQKGVQNVSVNTIDSGNAGFDIKLTKDKERWRLFLIFGLLFLVAEMVYLKVVLK